MIFVKKNYTTGVFGANFLHKKCVNRDNGKFTTNQRKCFKMPNLWQKCKDASKQHSWHTYYDWHFISINETKSYPLHLAEEGKVTLVGSCNKVPPVRRMSNQNMDICKGNLFPPPAVWGNIYTIFTIHIDIVYIFTCTLCG